jgi:hypothetical protein
MTARTAAVGIGILLLLAIVGAAGVLIAKGTTGPGVIGLLLGIGLGGLNLCMEGFSLSWALRRRPSATLGVSLGGFALRLVMVCGLTLWFGNLESVDAMVFALAYVASFMVFLGLQIWAITRMLDNAGPSRGAKPEGAELPGKGSEEGE